MVPRRVLLRPLLLLFDFEVDLAVVLVVLFVCEREVECVRLWVAANEVAENAVSVNRAISMRTKRLV